MAVLEKVEALELMAALDKVEAQGLGQRDTSLCVSIFATKDVGRLNLAGDTEMTLGGSPRWRQQRTAKERRQGRSKPR